MYSYQIDGKKLVIKDENTGMIVWQGKPHGCSVKKIVRFENPPGCVVLLDYDEYEDLETKINSNLLFISQNGDFLWHAELPSTSDDVYVELSEEGPKISANSMNGFYVHIDVNNGKIIDLVFTK